MKTNLSTPVIVAVVAVVLIVAAGIGWYFTMREAPLRLRGQTTAGGQMMPGNAGKGGRNAPMPVPNGAADVTQ